MPPAMAASRSDVTFESRQIWSACESWCHGKGKLLATENHGGLADDKLSRTIVNGGAGSWLC